MRSDLPLGDLVSNYVDLSISDQSQLVPLRDFLALTVPDVCISLSAKAPEPGEQGVLDTLVLVASSGGVVAAIRALPQFLRARRSGISITTKVKGEPFTLTATNVDEVMPILERILDA
jgi:hypothetical protein